MKMLFKPLVMFTLSLIIAACETENVIEVPAAPLEISNTLNFWGDYGRFIAVNSNSNDTVYIEDSGKIGELKVKEGNVVKISFEPREEYRDTIFISSYTLYDGNTVKNQLTYQMIVQGIEPGKYVVDLWVRPSDVTLELKESSKLVLLVETN